MKTLLAALMVSTLSLSATATELNKDDVLKMTDSMVKADVVELTQSVNEHIAMDIEDTLYVMQMPLNDYAKYVMAKVDSNKSTKDDALLTE